jgi:TetR/AcrR family transcriptional regulator, cholesterol catabolism regulator
MSIREKGRENDILQAASRLFTEKGFHKATIEDIAEGAGIGKGTVYEYFKNKNELFIKMIEHNINLYHSSISEKLKSNDGFIDRLYSFIDLHEEIIRQNIQSVNFMIESGGMSLVEPETKKTVCELMINSRNAVVKMILTVLGKAEEEGKIRKVDGELAADMFYAMVIRSCVRFVMHNMDRTSIESEKHKLIDLFINGIK